MSIDNSTISSKSPISKINELLKNIPPPPEKIPYPPKLVLYVIVIQGRNLSSKGCYCCLQIGNKTVETSSENNSHDPIWNEQFHFRKVDFCDHIIIQLLDHDSNKIGSIKLPLVDLNVNEISDEWYPISKNEKKSSEVRIAFHLATRYDPAFQGSEIKIEAEKASEIDKNTKTIYSKNREEKKKESSKYSANKAERSDESD